MAPHYRMPVFSQISENFDCDFYFGDKMQNPIKKLNYNELKGFKKEASSLNLSFIGGFKPIKLSFNIDFILFSNDGKKLIFDIYIYSL